MLSFANINNGRYIIIKCIHDDDDCPMRTSETPRRVQLRRTLKTHFRWQNYVLALGFGHFSVYNGV